MIFVLLVFLIIQLYFIFLLNRRNVFSPSFFVTASFLLSSIVLVTNWKFFGYEDISFESVLIVLASIIFFTLGEFTYKSYVSSDRKILGLYTRNIGNSDLSDNEDDAFVVSKPFVIVTIALCILVTLARAYIVFRLSQALGNSSGFLASFSYVRKYVNAGNSVDIGRIITYPAVFAKAASLYCIYVYCHNKVYFKKSSVLLVVPVIAYSLYTLTTTARTGVLEIACAFAIMYYAFTVQKNGGSVVGNKKIIRITVIVIVILILVFIISGNIRSITHEDNSASDLINYLGSPLIVFSRWQRNYEHSPIVGYATAPGLINILNRLGIIKTNISYSDIYSAEEVLANSKSNLKTWLKAPIQDYYLLGMLFSRFIIGILYGMISNRILNKNVSCKHPGRFIFYCLLFYPLISACIADKYGNYIQLETVYMILLFYAFSKFKRRWEHKNGKNIIS